MKTLTETKAQKLKSILLEEFNPIDIPKKIEREIKNVKLKLDEQLKFLENDPSTRTIFLLNQDTDLKKLTELKAEYYVTKLVHESITEFYFNTTYPLDVISDQLISKIQLSHLNRKYNAEYLLIIHNLLTDAFETIKTKINLF